MAQNYTRQSSFSDGDTITASLFNNEYNQVVNAFSYSSSSDSSTGHRHDGSAGQGGNIPQIGDLDFNNKIVVDATNNRWGVYVEVSGSAVEQIRIQDGAIVPVTDNDIDLGTSSLEFKDLFLDGTAHVDTLDVDVNATVAGTLGVTGVTTLSSDLSVGGNLTVTGNATIAGNLTFGDAASDTVAFSADVASNLLPSADNTYDLGASGSEWKDLYIDGTANIDSLVADTADINGGTIDGATIATSDITVGSGKTLNVSAGTLTLADDQISGDKVEGGTIAATTITTLTSTTGNITSVNATTVDTTNLEVTTLKAKDGSAAGSIADSTGVVTLASSVLTTTDINGGTIDGVTIGGSSAGDITYANLSDGTITITAFADEDDMSSNSATLVPTQQSVKAYVDAQVTAQDLDFQADSGGALSIDLDSETMTFTGGTGIDTSGSGNAVTFAIDSTVTTLAGTQTLTNKTLTTPVITSISNSGTVTLPSGTTTLVGTATSDVLTNKTISGSSNTLSNIGNSSLSNSSVSFGGISVALGSSDATPAFDLSDATGYTGDSSLVTTGTISSGVWQGTAVADTYVANDLTISGGTVNNTVIGGSSPAAADFTTVDTTGNATIGGNLAVTGNLTINGTTSTVNSTTVTIDDPIFTLGGDTTPSTDDNKDRGIEFKWHNGTGAKLGFFGYDDSASVFTFIPDASNTSEVFSGSAGNVAFGAISGTSFASTGNMTFGDNDKAIFGAGSDLQIYHSGSHSFISEAGTGDLYIGASNNIALMNAAFSENKLLATTDGALTLYHNGSAKLATTATGVDVTGTVTATKLVSANGVLELDDNGTHNGVINAPASLFINIDSDGNSAGEDFIIGKDRTGTSGGTE